jgi:Outer membrane protein beta-barrel domain
MTTFKCVAGVLGAAVLSTLAPTSAWAQDSGFYLGVDAGGSRSPRSLRLSVDQITLVSRDGHTTEFSWAFNTGYRFNRFVALELSYVDLGKLVAPLAGVGAATAGQGTYTFSAKGLRLAAVGSFPVGHWEPYLKAGVLRARVEASLSGTDGSSAFDIERYTSSSAVFAGLGTHYDIGTRWVVGLELDHYGSIGRYHITGALTKNALTFGIAYRF